MEHGGTDPSRVRRAFFQGAMAVAGLGADHQHLHAAGFEQQFQQTILRGVELGPGGGIALELLKIFSG